jgi:RNA polymerase sigma factor (sigma-70 family)
MWYLVFCLLPAVVYSWTQNALYQNYQSWAISKARNFKRVYKYKCAHISLEELSMYSSLGLWKAVQNYNGNTRFDIYAEWYVMGELYEGLTKLYPISNVSKYERKMKNKLQPGYLYKKKISTKFVGSENWMFGSMEDNISNFEDYSEYWRKIQENTTPFQRRIFTLRYDFFLDIIRTNKHVAELSGCSEEYVRRENKKTIQKILGAK